MHTKRLIVFFVFLLTIATNSEAMATTAENMLRQMAEQDRQERELKERMAFDDLLEQAAKCMEANDYGCADGKLAEARGLAGTSETAVLLGMARTEYMEKKTAYDERVRREEEERQRRLAELERERQREEELRAEQEERERQARIEERRERRQAEREREEREEQERERDAELRRQQDEAFSNGLNMLVQGLQEGLNNYATTMGNTYAMINQAKENQGRSRREVHAPPGPTMDDIRNSPLISSGSTAPSNTYRRSQAPSPTPPAGNLVLVAEQSSPPYTEHKIFDVADGPGTGGIIADNRRPGASGNDSIGGSSRRPNYDETRGVNHCIGSFYDPNKYNWLTIQNKCATGITVVYVTNNGAHGGRMELGPGGKDSTGWDSNEVLTNGGASYAACPSGYTPVDSTGSQWNRGSFNCRKWH